ncbi:YybH family protein [Sphingobacterium corticis]|uniref:YybH family protein n=1 Tax=Sphingobacterium corticis TaxID=1812823 RepID=A0ABW5NET3_9SPHI
MAQLPEKVGSLISVDRNAANTSNRENPHAGLISIVDKESSFFVPSSVNALNYLNNRPNLPDRLNWQPNFALVSRSLDWGVTSGPTQYQRTGAIKRFGQYVTIWRRDKKGNWRVHVRAEVENYGKQEAAKLEYFEPDNQKYLKHRSMVRLNQREEVVFQTDKLFSHVLKADTRAGYTEFLADDVRYYFPWQPEIVGRDKVIDMFTKERIEIDTEPEDVGRAYSGEFAYTSGTATVGLKDKVVKFNYIRVWQLKNDYQWKIILEMMFER